MGDEPSTSTGGGRASRRKMAFRAARFSTAENQAAATLANFVTAPSTSARALVAEQAAEPAPAERKSKPKSWEHQDRMIFYDALKQHGKDFDLVSKFLAKRKIERDREQCKNYFFNSLKIIKNVLAVTDEQLSDVPKDARELFLVLNACEWKKKTQNGIFNVARIKELFFKGQTVVRLNKKSVFIRTPVCPSLVRWFTRERKAEKFPSELHILLRPNSQGDAALLRSRCHNPFLKVKMDSNDKIHKLFELLQKKWNQGETWKTWQYRVRLFPSANVEVGSLKIRETDISPHIVLSMNKLRKELEITRSEVRPPNPLNVLPATENIRVDPVYTCIYPRPFAINDKIIKNGLNINNSKNVIVAELFLVCGMKDNIELCYEIDCDRIKEKKKFFNEPWRAMLELIARDYGKSVSSARKEENDLIKEEMKRKERERERELIESRRPAVVEPLTKKSRMELPPPQKQQHPLVDQSKTSYNARVVQEENEEFAQQLMRLNATKQSKKPLVNLMRPHFVEAARESLRQSGASPFVVPRLNTAPSKMQTTQMRQPTTFAYTAPPPLQAPQPSTSYSSSPIVQAPRVAEESALYCQLIPRKQPAAPPMAEPVRTEPVMRGQPPTRNDHQYETYDRKEKKSSALKTDFSGIVLSPVKRTETAEEKSLQSMRNNDFLYSLRTPTKTPASTPYRQPSMTSLFGDELSRSPTMSRKSVPPHDDDVSHCELTDMLFGEISMTPTKFATSTRDAADVSMSSLGFTETEVQQTYADMMNSSQDSRDFLMDHFKSKSEKKKKR